MYDPYREQPYQPNPEWDAGQIAYPALIRHAPAPFTHAMSVCKLKTSAISQKIVRFVPVNTTLMPAFLGPRRAISLQQQTFSSPIVAPVYDYGVINY